MQRFNAIAISVFLVVSVSAVYIPKGKLMPDKASPSVVDPKMNEVRFKTVTCNINRMYLPVCGSDGLSYINADALKCASQERTEKGLADLEVKHQGVCSEGDTVPDKTEELESNEIPDTKA